MLSLRRLEDPGTLGSSLHGRHRETNNDAFCSPEGSQRPRCDSTERLVQDARGWLTLTR